MKNLVSWLLCVVMLSACGEATIDVSSQEALNKSVADARDGLPEDQRSLFDESIKILAFSQLDMKDIFAAGSGGSAAIEARMMGALSGKTAEQIIAEAQAIKSEQATKEKQRALAEIEKLEQRRSAAEEATEQLKKVVVTRARVYLHEGITSKEQAIEFAVRNGTEHAIAVMRLEATVSSPNRSVPWLVDSFLYPISGGLEPGEEKSWKIGANAFPLWNRSGYPADAVLTLTVTRIDDANRKVIFSNEGFSEQDEKLLAELKNKYAIK